MTKVREFAEKASETASIAVFEDLSNILSSFQLYNPLRCGGIDTVAKILCIRVDNWKAIVAGAEKELVQAFKSP